MFTKRKFSFLIFSSLFLPLSALAAGVSDLPPNVDRTDTLGDNPILSIISSVVDSVWIIFVGVGVICIMVAGVLFLTAGGAPDKLQKARSAFLWGVIGVAVGILAFSIILLIQNALGV